MSQKVLGYSGSSYDRWVERNSNSSAFGKVQKQFWFTKSAVIRKFGKKEDEHIVASDAELDAKILLFHAIEESTHELQALLIDYQTRLCLLAQEENALGRLMKEFGKQDQTRAGKMMLAAGKGLSYTAQQRVHMRNPLVRLFQEVDTFQTRAVQDTLRTVEDMEKIRTEYRGALMWMKNISQDFNPDQYQQLEKFREVQSIVKQKKMKFDQLKIKSLQKIDLLAASRCNMFSHALIFYQNNLITFSEKTAKTLNSVASNFRGYHPFKFQIIKELAEPASLAECEDKEDDDSVIDLDNDEETFFNAEYKDEPNAKQREKKSSARIRRRKSDSLLNLFNDKEQDDVLSNENNLDCSQDKNFGAVDLLTEDNSEKCKEASTEELLKELFETPLQENQTQHLPVFGCESSTDLNCQSTVNVSANLSSTFPYQPSSPLPNQAQMFMPSQLLDYAYKDCWSGGYFQPAPIQQEQFSCQQQSGTLSENLSTQQFSSNPFFNDLELHKRDQLEKRPVALSSSEAQKKETKSKLDWYKVFQDIDPLSDPANAIFGKNFDNKKC